MRAESKLETAKGSGTLVSQLSETLRQAIAAGQYSPGSRLPSEAQLTEADAGSLIMAARAHWFGDEAAGAGADGAAVAGVPPTDDVVPTERAQ